jgi:hypothetical protein
MVTLFVELRKMGNDRIGFDHGEAANCNSEGAIVAIPRLNLEELCGGTKSSFGQSNQARRGIRSGEAITHDFWVAFGDVRPQWIEEFVISGAAQQRNEDEED